MQIHRGVCSTLSQISLCITQLFSLQFSKLFSFFFNNISKIVSPYHTYQTYLMLSESLMSDIHPQ